MVKLSIIITYYKTYDLTKKLLEELRKQKTDDIEIILIDDGCNETRLDEFKDFIDITHLEKNGGFAHALNVGMGKVKGKYVGFIDSDDMIVENYIETLLKAIDQYKQEIIFFNWKDINTGEIVYHPCNYAMWKAIYKREIIPKFNEEWKFNIDVPFQDDLNKRKHSNVYLDDILYLYNSGREGSLTKTKERIMSKDMIKCEVIKEFTLEKFNDLENIQRKSIDTKGKLYVGDIFECSSEMASYLMGNNDKRQVVVKIIELEPEELEVKEPQDNEPNVEEPKTDGENNQVEEQGVEKVEENVEKPSIEEPEEPEVEPPVENVEVEPEVEPENIENIDEPKEDSIEEEKETNVEVESVEEEPKPSKKKKSSKK